MKFYLVRHGETEWNKLGRFQGQYDTQLNDAGLEQAKVIGQAAREWDLAAIYASPLMRTMQVAGEIGEALGLPVSPREGLMELGLGELEGVTGEVMRAGWPQVFNTWNSNPELAVMPGGESLETLEKRSWKVILELQESHGPDDNLAIISHNFTIRAICGKVLGMPLANFHRMRLDLGSVSVFDMDRRGPRLLTYNSTCHLQRQNPPTTDGRELCPSLPKSTGRWPPPWNGPAWPAPAPPWSLVSPGAPIPPPCSTALTTCGNRWGSRCTSPI